jgi:hypothetical protein
MDNTESRIAPSPEAASDDFASPCNPRPGERDRLAFDPVPLRYREDGLTPEKQRAYVEALADCGIAREAAARVGVSEQAINRVRRRSDARSFDDACEAAHLSGARRIRSTIWERAIEGIVKGRYYRGELIAEERVYDNRLLTYLYGKVEHLLARDEKKSRAICANWEAHMDALEQGLPPPGSSEAKAAQPEESEWTGYEAREDEDGIWWTSFPPPAGFDGEEQGEFGDEDYKRSLSPREQAVLDAEYDRDDAEYRARETARRDRFFGFAGDEVSPAMEAETYETSEPSEAVHSDPRPIEYKSLVPPSPTRPPSSRRRPGPMNATVPGFARRCSRIPDQGPPSKCHFDGNPVRDDEEPSPARSDKRPPLRPPHIQIPPPRHPYR